MNLRLLALAPLAAALLALPAAAQGLKLPRPSTAAKVMATAGYTEVSVEWSSPAVKGRKVWGALVPYGAVWRAGANEPSKVTFSTDATIDGKKVPAGTYAFYVIPAEGADWTVILSKELKLWGAFGYKADSDLLRVAVKPEAAPHRERLGFQVLDAGETGGKLVLEWEQVRLTVPFQVDTKSAAMKEINAIKGDDWRPYNAAARYLFDSNQETELALQLVDKSIKHKDEWLNNWTKALLLQRKGDVPAAHKAAQKAQELGKKAQNFFYADEVAKALAEWK